MYALCLRGERIEVGTKLMCSLSIGSVQKTHFFLTSLPTSAELEQTSLIYVPQRLHCKSDSTI